MNIDFNKVPTINDTYNYLQDKEFDKKHLVILNNELNIIYKQKVYYDGSKNYGTIYYRCPVNENNPKEPIGVIK